VFESGTEYKALCTSEYLNNRTFMTRTIYDAPNKKSYRISSSIRYCWPRCRWCFQYFIGACTTAARVCQFGFNRDGLFFLKYFKSKDRHYKNDIKPIFEAWSNLTVQPIEFNAPLRGKEFENLQITTANDLIRIDPKSMGRLHLDSYPIKLNSILDRINEYNQGIHNFIEELEAKMRRDISTNIPSLKEYGYNSDERTNFYHFVNISYYLWTKFWEERPEAELVITDYNNQIYELRKLPGEDILATSNDKDNISKLKQYVDGRTPDVLETLRQLKDERNKIIPDFQNFTNSIHGILDSIYFNRGFKGKCQWERGFFGITWKPAYNKIKKS
jgi:hypothetical protein